MNFENYKDAFIAAVLDIAKNNNDVVFLDADLASCIGSTAFQNEYPDRFFNCGIAEANMAAVAAGLSSMGYTPYIHSFGCFASRRDYDQLFISVGYANRTVHVIGTDPGITAQYNGGTHMPFEDIALMRQIPNFSIVEPSDDYSLYVLTKQLYEEHKPSYTRMPRKGVIHRYSEKDDIRLGKSMELSDGKDVAIIALGALLVNEAMKAKDILAEKGIQATVIDLLSVRPLDTETLEKVRNRCDRILVCENGRYCGGVGEMISSYYSKTNPVKMEFINVGDRFGEVGSLDYLSNTFGFNCDNIVDKVVELCE